jgi:hypothetical protein
MTGGPLLSGYNDVTNLGLLSDDGDGGLSFRDFGAGGGEVSYVLELKRDDGTSQFFGPRSLSLEASAASVGPRLISASPNPFFARVEFLYFIPEARPVTLHVFDAAGRSVHSNTWTNLGPGVHRLGWDGRTASGSRAGAGVYFYLVQSEGKKDSGKLLLVR